MIYSDNIVTNDCTFISEGVHNGDGWDPDSSTNCTIFACTFFTGDDSVAIKSGKNPEGNIINKPCKHIRVFDCVTKYGHGICMGSEMSGGIEDVKIWDCDLENSVYGIEIKGTKKRGGYVIEDDFDSEFFLPGQPIESLYSLDRSNSVIYINTFSKSLTPAMRLGYMILPEALLNEYDSRLSRFSCTVPVLEQHALAEFISCGGFERHLNRKRRRMKSLER